MTTDTQPGAPAPRQTPASEVERARAELTAALDAIEDKLNVPKQLRRARDRVDDFRKENPAVFGAVVAGVTVVVGAVAWLGVRAIRR